MLQIESEMPLKAHVKILVANKWGFGEVTGPGGLHLHQQIKPLMES